MRYVMSPETRLGATGRGILEQSDSCARVAHWTQLGCLAQAQVRREPDGKVCDIGTARLTPSDASNKRPLPSGSRSDMGSAGSATCTDTTLKQTKTFGPHRSATEASEPSE